MLTTAGPCFSTRSATSTTSFANAGADKANTSAVVAKAVLIMNILSSSEIRLIVFTPEHHRARRPAASRGQPARQAAQQHASQCGTVAGLQPPAPATRPPASAPTAGHKHAMRSSARCHWQSRPQRDRPGPATNRSRPENGGVCAGTIRRCGATNSPGPPQVPQPEGSTACTQMPSGCGFDHLGGLLQHGALTFFSPSCRFRSVPCSALRPGSSRV